MNQADETQANLAFVALRQEPFLVEEFNYLANQIQDLHEVRVELEVERDARGGGGCRLTPIKQIRAS